MIQNAKSDDEVNKSFRLKDNFKIKRKASVSFRNIDKVDVDGLTNQIPIRRLRGKSEQCMLSPFIHLSRNC